MAVSAVTPQAPPGAYALDELLTGLAGLQAYFKTHENPPLPGGPQGVILNIRVPGAGRGERLTNLAVIAELLGVQETRIDGGLAAQRRFGPFLLEAHVRDDEKAGTEADRAAYLEALA
jgi:hypothetical protein